jgi:hypothetical protein
VAGLFRLSGVFGISVPDNRCELLIIGPGYLEYSFYASYTLLERDAENSYLAMDAVAEVPIIYFRFG